MLLNNKNKTTTLLLLLAAALLGMLCASSLPVTGQQDNDNDDFDDQGFDDSGYNSPQNHDAEGSNQQPRNQSPSDEEDLDDDDDVDETHMRPQLASQSEDQQQQQQGEQQQHQPGYYGYPAAAPQRFYSSPESMILANIAPVQPNEEQDAYQQQAPQYNRRIRRSIEDPKPEGALSRQKRHSKYIGPVYTYVKTDKHARFKWGVKHKVGKHGK